VSPKSEQRRALETWLEMIHQLRYGAYKTAQQWPGNPQSFLEHLVEREVRLELGSECAASLASARHTNCNLRRETIALHALWEQLPEKFKCARDPHQIEGDPIFLRIKGRLLLIDGRRRLNYWSRQDPDKMMTIWVIEYA
jgi:hypothetical protein